MLYEDGSRILNDLVMTEEYPASWKLERTVENLDGRRKRN